MPHFWNHILVVTKDELVPTHFPTWKALKMYLDRYESPRGIQRVRRGGNGRQMLMSYDSLPNKIKEAFGDPRKIDHPFETYYKTDPDARDFFSGFTFKDGTYLSKKHQEEYTIEASVIQTVLKFKDSELQRLAGKKIKITEMWAFLCTEAHLFNNVLRKKYNTYHKLPANARVFQTKIERFQSGGYFILMSGKHKNDNPRKVDEETLQLLNCMFGKDKTKPTARKVKEKYDAFISGKIEVINNKTGECYDPNCFKKLSVRTITGYLHNWENKIGTFTVRSGDRQQDMQNFKPHHSMAKPKYAGSLLSIDDRQPPFKLPDGNRIWFYLGLDVASQAFTCWVFGKSKEGIIIEFYRQLIRNYAEWGLNLPYELEAEMSLNSSYRETFLRSGVMFQEVRIEANNARGKYIERCNRELRYEIEKEYDGWVARPFARSEANQAGPKAAPSLTESKIIEIGLRAIEEFNNRPHESNPNICRWEYFLDNQNPDLRPINYLAILPYIGYKTITSVNVGIIRFRNSEFLLGQNGKVAIGQNLINYMKQVEGHNVEIRWLNDNYDNVLKALIFKDSRFICEAVAKPVYQRAKAEQTEADLEKREIMSAYVATIEGFRKKQQNTLEELVYVNVAPKPKMSFTIPGLRGEPVTTFTETEFTETEPEILPEPPEENYEIPTESFNRPLWDRFLQQ